MHILASFSVDEILLPYNILFFNTLKNLFILKMSCQYLGVCMRNLYARYLQNIFWLIGGKWLERPLMSFIENCRNLAKLAISKHFGQDSITKKCDAFINGFFLSLIRQCLLANKILDLLTVYNLDKYVDLAQSYADIHLDCSNNGSWN